MVDLTKKETLSCLSSCVRNDCKSCHLLAHYDVAEDCMAELIRNAHDCMEEQEKNSEKITEEIAKLTHELRNHMTSVTRYVRMKKTENISDEFFADRQVKYKSYAESSVSSILSLLNDNDTLTRIEKGVVLEVDNEKCKGKREIAEEIKEEINAALKSNFKARNERVKRLNEKGLSFVKDDFIRYCDGKIDALTGISDFIDELIEKM